MSKDSIRRPKTHEDMLYKLCQSENKIFLSYKDALVFAACLGFVKYSRKNFSDSKDPIKMHIFDDVFDQAIINCIGLAETENPNILGDEMGDKRVLIFEEYAAAGLDLINTKIFLGPKEWEISILELIDEYSGQGPDILNDITQFAS